MHAGRPIPPIPESVSSTQDDDTTWQVRSGLALHEIQSLLDWLENCGSAIRDLQIDLSRAVVRWRRAPDSEAVTAKMDYES